MRPFAVRGAHLATLCGVLLVCVTVSMICAGSAAAANPCNGWFEGYGFQDPPNSGIWYQCQRRNPNSGQDIIAVPQPDWPEVPMALLWPLSALLAFGLYAAVQRRRRPQPAPTL
jgi:hypothetical protein